jgi:hypothetical protein
MPTATLFSSRNYMPSNWVNFVGMGTKDSARDLPTVPVSTREATVALEPAERVSEEQWLESFAATEDMLIDMAAEALADYQAGRTRRIHLHSA